MRKTLKIFIVIILLSYYLTISIYSNIKYIEYIQMALFCILIPYAIYELLQIQKDDKVNGTSKLKSRLVLSFIALVIMLILYFIR